MGYRMYQVWKRKGESPLRTWMPEKESRSMQKIHLSDKVRLGYIAVYASGGIWAEAWSWIAKQRSMPAILFTVWTISWMQRHVLNSDPYLQSYSQSVPSPTHYIAAIVFAVCAISWMQRHILNPESWSLSAILFIVSTISYTLHSCKCICSLCHLLDATTHPESWSLSATLFSVCSISYTLHSCNPIYSLYHLLHTT